jgi:hypothetical protein
MLKSSTLVCCLSLLTCSLMAQTTTTFYVMAKSGLNLRQSADANSEKLMLLPLGAKLTMLTPAASKNMTVDNLKGGMAKVKYNDKTGFVFDGYLSIYPKPNDLQRDEDDRTETYVDQLREANFECSYETYRIDHGGYISGEDGIHFFNNNNWQEIFCLAKILYDLPQKLTFPKAGETKQVNPDKNTNAWNDELNTERNKDGSIKSIRYVWRGEGGGWGIIIEKSKAINGVKIGKTYIAD